MLFNQHCTSPEGPTLSYLLRFLGFVWGLISGRREGQPPNIMNNYINGNGNYIVVQPYCR